MPPKPKHTRPSAQERVEKARLDRENLPPTQARLMTRLAKAHEARRRAKTPEVRRRADFAVVEAVAACRSENIGWYLIGFELGMLETNVIAKFKPLLEETRIVRPVLKPTGNG